VRDGVTFDQQTDKPITGLWVHTAEVWKYETPYKDGKLDGVERVFLWESGQLIRKTSYKNGMRHGLSETFDYGYLKTSSEWFEDQKNGLFRQYNFKELVQEGRYLNGKREGYWLDEDPPLPYSGRNTTNSGTGHYLGGKRIDENDDPPNSLNENLDN